MVNKANRSGKLKIAVIGGGSSYTPELINGFLQRLDTLPVDELWLMDVSAERLEIVGSFAQRMVAAKGAPFTVHLTTDLHEAVQGASYVATQLRVGMMPARRADEYLGHKYGLIGQETTGIGGMAKALRTIPVILDIACEMRDSAPDALLINFTNPAGLVVEALTRYAPDIQSVGVCNVAINAKMTILRQLEQQLGRKLDPAQAQLKTLGLNHLTWHYGFTLDGEDVWPTVMQGIIQQAKGEAHPAWDVATLESLQMLPNYYLQYFYYTDKKLAEQALWPPSRAEQVAQIEDDLLRQYAEPDRTEPPADLMKRGGAYYSTVATQLINAHYNDLGEAHVVNVRNNGAVADWPHDWVLELPAQVNRSEITPLPSQALPPVCFGLVAQIKAYELLTVEAAVHGDRNAAYQALLTHPLGPSADKVQTVLDDMLETHQAHLPQFFGQAVRA